MSPRIPLVLALCAVMCLTLVPLLTHAQPESPEDRATRVAWWKEARFGLFLHWGLYAVPAGTWGSGTDFGEWIRHSARIPLEKYDRFLSSFNPVRFNAATWVTMAKNAGMKYIVITSKHHDGFCLFDSRQTSFTVLSTPFRRDILKELSDECRKQGIRLCWYYSIMDWHHPDYLPRREWETTRSAEGADQDRYVSYMKEQLRELLTSYGEIGVLWFDGEWESTWNRERGKDLAAYVRSLQPTIIINNRVDGGRSGMEGFSHGEPSAGDFGTPEQQVPPTGLPGADWETCMTMNEHWGYNRNDHAWKSSGELVRTLADIASKGGNFLLNVGPTAEGTFPKESVQRLADIGAWMNVNSTAIYGTSASPFAGLPWGRCTKKEFPGGTRLFLHVFDWPSGGSLTVPGLLNTPLRASLLADPSSSPLVVERLHDGVRIALPQRPPDTINSVIVLDISALPEVCTPPELLATADIFVDTTTVTFAPVPPEIAIRYSIDGTDPGPNSNLYRAPIRLTHSATIAAQCYRDGIGLLAPSRHTLTRVTPAPARSYSDVTPGVRYRYFEGTWDSLPDFSTLVPRHEGVQTDFTLSSRLANERFAFEYTGLLRVPRTGVYTFAVESDDGSRLWLGDAPLVENDGLHGLKELDAVVALEAGLHPIRLEYFQKTGGDGLRITWAPAGGHRVPVAPSDLVHTSSPQE